MPSIAQTLISAARDGICRARSGLDARCSQRRLRLAPMSAEAAALRHPARSEGVAFAQEHHMSEQMISRALIRANFGRSEELGVHLAELVARVQRDRGCLGYELRQQGADSWHLHGVWSSAEALQEHLQQPHLQVFQYLIGAGLIRQMELVSHNADQPPA